MLENRPFGDFLKLSVRGESHAPAIEFDLAGFPEGFRIDRAALAAFMERRAPGRDALSTSRRETDAVEFTGGLADGVTTGATVSGRIANENARPGDYGSERTVPRPGHADFGQWIERGRIPSGGGENSGRLTAALCAAGGICLQWLARRGVSVSARVESIGGEDGDCAAAVAAARDAGDSVGGVVRCEIAGLAAGLGGALFAGIESRIAPAVFAIPGVKGIEFGNGFAASRLRGSENNDPFIVENGLVKTVGNRHGGILGGRASGMPVEFRVAMKPTPTIFIPQPSVDLASMTPAECKMKGRHDPCIVRRAVPVVEAMAAFAVADLMMSVEASFPRICLTLTGRTLAECAAQFASQRYFTDMVELRVDLLDAAERARAAEFPAMVPVRTILTFRRRRDGGAFDGADAEREDFFRRVLRPGCGFAFVDFEDDFRPAGLAEAAAAADARVIRSLHDFTGPIENIVGRCRAMRGDTMEIPKIAFMPKCAADVDRLFAETSDFTDFPHILCAMGPLGLRSRVFAAKTHSMLTYASVGGLGAIGHVTPFDLVRKYGIRTVPTLGEEHT